MSQLCLQDSKIKAQTQNMAQEDIVIYILAYICENLLSSDIIFRHIE